MINYSANLRYQDSKIWDKKSITSTTKKNTCLEPLRAKNSPWIKEIPHSARM